MSQACKHGEMRFKEGVGAKGPWKGYFCPTPKGTPDQCKPQFINDKGPRATAPQRFEQGMEVDEVRSRQDKKDSMITRLAIAKSLIESCEKHGLESIAEAEKWLAWVEGRGQRVATSTTAARTDEVPLSDIPF